MSLRTIMWWGVIAFAIWWIIQNPAIAGGDVHALGRLATHVANGFSNFITDTFK